MSADLQSQLDSIEYLRKRSRTLNNQARQVEYEVKSLIDTFIERLKRGESTGQSCTEFAIRNFDKEYDTILPLLRRIETQMRQSQHQLLLLIHRSVQFNGGLFDEDVPYLETELDLGRTAGQISFDRHRIVLTEGGHSKCVQPPRPKMRKRNKFLDQPIVLYAGQLTALDQPMFLTECLWDPKVRTEKGIELVIGKVALRRWVKSHPEFRPTIKKLARLLLAHSS